MQNDFGLSVRTMDLGDTLGLSLSVKQRLSFMDGHDIKTA
jgi:hypothetical protein